MIVNADCNFPINEVSSHIHSSDQIKEISECWSEQLQAPFVKNKTLFLYALAGQETSFGKYCIPRAEPNFLPGGIYYRSSKVLREMYDLYGATVGCSFGPWQLMYATAKTILGYEKHPLALHSAFVSIPFVVKYLNLSIDKGAKTTEALFVSYNLGWGSLIQEPKNWSSKGKFYVASAMEIYQKLLKQ